MNMIEDIKVTEASCGSDHHNIHISFAQTQSCPANIVKPSSLNYKIGLKTAVEEFLKKETKIDDF